MKRVLIIGCGGSGKSTLARALGDKTGLPVVHLDQIFWEPGNWQHLPREEFDQRILKLMEQETWILDGNYDRTLPMRLSRCDTVIYLDFNRFTCIFGWLKRVIAHWGTARPDMAPGCNEWLDPEFFRWLWNYNKENRDKNYALLAQATHAQVIVLRNRRQVHAFLENME